MNENELEIGVLYRSKKGHYNNNLLNYTGIEIFNGKLKHNFFCKKNRLHHFINPQNLEEVKELKDE